MGFIGKAKLQGLNRLRKKTESGVEFGFRGAGAKQAAEKGRIWSKSRKGRPQGLL
jgi:hypothetical protein